MIHHIATPLAWIAEGALLRQYAVKRWPYVASPLAGIPPAEVGFRAMTRLTRELFNWATEDKPWLN